MAGTIYFHFVHFPSPLLFLQSEMSFFKMVLKRNVTDKVEAGGTRDVVEVVVRVVQQCGTVGVTLCVVRLSTPPLYVPHSGVEPLPHAVLLAYRHPCVSVEDENK